MKTKQTKITTRQIDSFGNSMVHENILLSCNKSFNLLLGKSSSRSLKCSERKWPMYNLLRLTLVQEWKRIGEVLDNRAWIRILPSSVHDIFYTFKEIIQFKQIYLHPKVDMYHPFYLKILIENPLHRLSARRKTNSTSDISYYKKYFLKKELNSASGKKKKTIKKSLHGK